MGVVYLTTWITAISILLGMIAILLSVYGAARTQRALGQAHQRDKLIDAMAWVDRRLFHGGVSVRSPRS